MTFDAPLRVVFLGTPAFAIPSLEGIVRSGAELRAVVCQPDRPSGRGLLPTQPATKVWAAARGIPVLQPDKVKNGRLTVLLQPFAPDILVVAAYGRILPPDVLAMAPLGAINCHASVLPRYRGAAPIQWAIARGETETGVTIMQMDEGLDTGDVLLVRRLPIGAQETAAELTTWLAALAGEAICEALPGLARRELRPTPQDHSQATLAPPLKKEDGTLDFQLSARELFDRTRAFDPWPGSVLFLGGRSMKVHRARARDGIEADRPGTIVSVGDALGIQAGDGVYEVLEIQPEGGRRMTAREFQAGHRLKAGELIDLVAADH